MVSVGNTSRDRTFFRTIISLIISLLSTPGFAQQPQQTWQQVWQENLSMEDDEEGTNIEDHYDLLQELAEHPIDLNRATREELERLPFLSQQQVMDFIEYRDRYKVLHSLGELRMVRTMGNEQMELLPFFTEVEEVADTAFFPRLGTIIANGRHKLNAAIRVPFYRRKGDTNGYLGYPYRHWTHYEFSYGSYVRIGLLGSQDAGEPFRWNAYQWGYDEYSYYLQIKKLGRIDNLVVGKYKLSAGMGLVLNSGSSLGKLAMLQNLGRQSNTLRVHASRSAADYFQGAAATISLNRKMKLTTFASYRPLDATLNDDGTVATLLYTSYHRTPNEIAKRHNTHQTALGADMTFRHQGMQLGATVVYTHQDRRLSPNTETLYRRHYASGNNFLNSSLHYGYMHHRFSVNGETAINRNGAMATINSLSFQPTASWSIVALQRFYSYRYTTLHGHAFSEGGKVQNESGFYIGTTWQPLNKLRLKGYADFTRFPWARYRISQPSTAQDYMAEAAYTPKRHWTLKGRYRLHLRQLDNNSKTGLRRHNEHRARLSVDYDNGEWKTTTQADAVKAVNYTIDYGWMVSQQVGWKHAWWQLSATAAYFNTDSYDSRLYAYERQLPHSFAIPMYYGRGYRLALVARAMIGKTLQIDGKIGTTHYSDHTSIGTGLQEINGSTMTDLDLQVRLAL